MGAALSSAAVVSVQERERRIEAKYTALPPADPSSLEQVEDRLIAIERLIDAHPISRQGFQMARERHRLRLELDGLEAAQLEEQRETEEASTSELLRAKSARVRGLALADGEDLEGAYRHFSESLENSSLTKEEAERIRRDMAAIDEFLEEKQ